MDAPLAPAYLSAGIAGLVLAVSLALEQGGETSVVEAPILWRPPTTDVFTLIERSPSDTPDALDPPLARLAGVPPRELRVLPGVGEARSVAIEREIWRRGTSEPGPRLSDVQGIGPKTARRVGARLGASAPVAGSGDP